MSSEMVAETFYLSPMPGMTQCVINSEKAQCSDSISVFLSSTQESREITCLYITKPWTTLLPCWDPWQQQQRRSHSGLYHCWGQKAVRCKAWPVLYPSLEFWQLSLRNMFNTTQIMNTGKLYGYRMIYCASWENIQLMISCPWVKTGKKFSSSSSYLEIPYNHKWLLRIHFLISHIFKRGFVDQRLFASLTFLTLKKFDCTEK